MRLNAENCREDSDPEKLGDVIGNRQWSHDFCGILVVSCRRYTERECAPFTVGVIFCPNRASMSIYNTFRDEQS